MGALARLEIGETVHDESESAVSATAPFIAAMFIISPRRTVHLANASAQEMLAVGRPLRVEHGVLTAPCATLQADLQHAVNLVFGGAGPQSVAFRRETTGARLIVEAMQGDPWLACVHVRDSQSTLRGIIDRACAVYRLTPAECTLAGALMQGSSPADYAEQRRIKMPTVRSQLSSLYAKTGVSGHNQLILALWTQAAL